MQALYACSNHLSIIKIILYPIWDIEGAQPKKKKKVRE